MNFPPPETRKCDACFNQMTINYFRLNSSICRYCEDGLVIPERLITNSPHSEDTISTLLFENEQPKEATKFVDNIDRESTYENINFLESNKDELDESLHNQLEGPSDHKDQLELLD